jgi:hypothetical protein
MPDDDESKVRDLIAQRALPLDPQTQADLEKWFGLPSVSQLEEEGKLAGPADADMAQVIERRDRALAAVDPVLLTEIRARTEDIPHPLGERLRTLTTSFDVVIDAGMAFFDHGMVDRALTIAEPREVEIPDALIDDLKECTPQALLRDLHRPELFYDKTFEIVDAAAEQRLDIVAEVRTAMRTSWKLPASAFGRSAVDESRDALAAVRTQRRQPWTSFLPLLPNRSVTE